MTRWRRDKSRYEHWTSPPASPIPYGVGARLSDAYNGYVDGRSGLPDPQPGSADGLPETPHSRLTRLRGSVQQLSESLRFLRKRAEEAAETGIDTLSRDLKAAEQNAADKRALFEAIPLELDAQAAGKWRAGELNTREDIVRSRRAAEHSRLRLAAEAEYQAAAERVAAAHAALERAVEAANRDADVERIRREWIGLHTQRRNAAYLRRLVRSHRAGPEIADYLAERPAPDERTDQGGTS